MAEFPPPTSGPLESCTHCRANMTTTGVCASCAQEAAEARAGSMVYVYARYKGQKNFRPMNLKANVQVNATMRATRLSRAEGDRFMATDALVNPDWEFELRAVPT